MDKVYIFGHKNPDTDSVTSAISLSYLKNKLGYKTIPCILGSINNETKYVLNYFKVDVPEYLNDTKLQIRDLNYKKNCFLKDKDTLYNLYNYMQKEEVTGIPIANDQNKYVSLITMKDLLKVIIDSSYHEIETSYANILNTLNGQKILQYDNEIKGFLVTDKKDFNKESIVVSNDKSLIKDIIKNKIKLLIITNKDILTNDFINDARKSRINIIYTNMEYFQILKLVILSNYIKTIVSNNKNILIDINAYVNDFEIIFNKYRYTNYPIVDKNNKILGLLRIEDIQDKKRKKVIMVDHNEYNQSVLGIEEASILEIVDHHKVGNINSSSPINIRNMAVGSTNTIIYQMYKENHLTPPKNIAGLMLSGIISDTLIFHSPTTTDLDKKAAHELSKISNIDISVFSKNMFEAASSIEGMTIEELIYNDFKSFNINDTKVGIGQITVIDYQSILDNKDKYLNIIEKISLEHNYQILAFCITDVINSNTYILYNEASKSIFETMFNISNLTEGYKLKGIVSRKKQIIPLLMEELNK